MIRAVALDAMGVIYRAGDDVGELLLPFLAGLGLPADRSIVEPLYVACSRGECTSTELWRRLGVTGPVDGLDEQYLDGHALNPGLFDLLAAAAQRGVLVAALTNDVAEWSLALRTRFAIATAIEPWVVSGDVGHRKPSPEIYAALLDRIEVPAGEVLFVDDRPANLDAAASLGLQTLLFSPDGGVPGCAAHPSVRSFAELADLLSGW